MSATHPLLMILLVFLGGSAERAGVASVDPVLP